MSTPPLPCDIYRHVKTGGLYRVVCIARVEATLELVVVLADPVGAISERRFV